RVVLCSYYQDDGYPGAVVVWRYLAKPPLSVEKGSQVKASPVDALETKLQGPLLVRIQHVDRVLVEARASELTLMRTDPSGDKWFLPWEEVERLAQANGIPSVPEPASWERQTVRFAVIGAGVVVVAALAGWLLFRARQIRAGR